MKNPNVTVDLDKEFFEKNKVKAEKAFDAALDHGSDTKGTGYRFEFNANKQELDVDTGEIEWFLDDEQGQWFTIKYRIDEEDMIRLAEFLIKRLNKAKALLETVVD